MWLGILSPACLPSALVTVLAAVLGYPDKNKEGFCLVHICGYRKSQQKPEAAGPVASAVRQQTGMKAPAQAPSPWSGAASDS